MRWRGETEAQRRNRLTDWHPYFAWLPTQLSSGEWVWLEKIWRIYHVGINGRMFPQYVGSAAEALEARAEEQRRVERMKKNPLPPKK